MTTANAEILPVFKTVCESCGGSGQGGDYDGRGNYRTSPCFRCGGWGSYEYTEQPKEITK